MDRSDGGSRCIGRAESGEAVKVANGSGGMWAKLERMRVKDKRKRARHKRERAKLQGELVKLVRVQEKIDAFPPRLLWISSPCFALLWLSLA